MKTPSFLLALVAPGLMASPLATDKATPTTLVTTPTTTPKAGGYNWAEGWQASFPIHSSCNSTLRAQLQGGLDDAVQLAQHARNHLLRFGGKSDIVKRYFGNGTLAEPIGWFDRIVAADKGVMTFRCDDPDGVCASMPTWGGHYRGKNATEETVICPLSFQLRRSLSSTCNLGYTVAGSPLNTIWAVDLLHRMFHVPTINENVVDHFADGYDEILALAKKDPAKTARDSNALQYFAIDVWAYDVAAPGVGCTGKAKPKA
ncbi:major allergen Asp F2 [Cordyceps fumosorosea ARSEF 2679]|uniref:Major allergen Asp F2 n=1 Tax=Cordyceps fumosorosea (strain ARSEF 2679) TaxID=1081104 RepID=A0A168BYW1_CORFA|nr:major allergen Asp F2 [Cordyceps fumosorosea ARSEF 2679]OAA70725.1 major allergen Asp F2 [Cordyceps fumosorosea ARSEF 2679]